ncbi:hypothetical protein [Burkholderia sp. S171]|uniref:hypothetical protein n=1 Tax=Burkholderia sp. S171 TaxID=1641860 RepID=UPI0020B16ABA|nr:hypothetical protein [Burkholderia sp. S171]
MTIEKIISGVAIGPASGLSKRLVTVALGVALMFAAPAFSFAQTATEPAQASASLGLPDVPTTRILAIGRLTSKSTPGAIGAVLPQEVRETVKLYLEGKIDQWYVRKDQASVVFILNITDVNEARRTLEQLPLGRADLMEFDLIPLGPLSPLAALGGSPNR